jgi:hypothetical protein
MWLDAEGLTLGGGLMLRPRRLLWREVEAFKVFRLPRGGKLVGYKTSTDALVRARVMD